ncbi:hypothetical protein [Nocardioides sp.]|uniref:hypothetical protein n=1 Tax=Nocardioides sp. TaxID=35761 RepID=UPI002BC9228B|nr:hypothetical protein [Nocardioides sp.]HXH78604.1 hypothetical protein [Nocardioides sp.]
MRFTEHELTVAVTSAAKTVANVRQRGVRRRAGGGAEETWAAMSPYERYQVLEPVGSQVLPALVALPDVEVAPGTRPSFTDAQVLAAIEETLGEAGGRLRRKVVVAARLALVRAALAQLPPRQDPDALTTDSA